MDMTLAILENIQKDNPKPSTSQSDRMIRVNGEKLINK